MTADDRNAATDLASEKAMSSVRATRDEAAIATSHALHGTQDSVDEADVTAGSAYARAKDAVQGLSGSLPNSATDAYRSSQRAYAQGSDAVASRVARQPFEALLLAGALGYLLGWATSRS